MESPEADIKPTIPADDISDKSLLTSGVNRLKQSRYEDVWPEDVHAAFMEAVALYPPMGKRRLRYYRVSTHENGRFSDVNRVKSFGRCQLIQSYILEKTGKDRSRKQVSSHLQRLKKIHKDNPAMRPLFSEHSQPFLDHFPVPSQDIFTFNTRHFKSDFDLANVQDADTSIDNSPTFPCVSEVSSFNYGGSCNVAIDFSTNLHNKPSVTPPQEHILLQQSPAHTFRSSNGDFLSELQDPLLFKDAINGGSRADPTFHTSAFSTSMRRLASRLPIQSWVDSYPATHFSRAIHTPASQPMHQWTSYDDLMNSIPCAPPFTPARQWFHAPFHSPHVSPAEKQRFDPVIVSDWAWPQHFDIGGLGPRDGAVSEIPPRYPLVAYQPGSSYTGMEVNSPVSQNSQLGREEPQFSQGISCSYMATSPAIMSGVSAETAIDVTRQVSSENFASPPVIRPTPIYPVSYVHSDDDPRMPTSNLDP